MAGSELRIHSSSAPGGGLGEGVTTTTSQGDRTREHCIPWPPSHVILVIPVEGVTLTVSFIHYQPIVNHSVFYFQNTVCETIKTRKGCLPLEVYLVFCKFIMDSSMHLSRCKSLKYWISVRKKSIWTNFGPRGGQLRPCIHIQTPAVRAQGQSSGLPSFLCTPTTPRPM